MPRVRVARRRHADLLYRLNRLALYALMLSYVPSILAAVAAMGYGALCLTMWGLRLCRTSSQLGARLLILIAALDIAVVFVAGLMLLGLLPLFFRDVQKQPYGERLDLPRHPNLHGLLQRLSKRLHVRPPDTCLLTPSDDTGIADMNIVGADGRVMRNVRTLLLGAALVVHTRINEFATIVCHEMVHAAAGDTRLSRLARRFHYSLVAQVMYHSGAVGARRRVWVSRIVYGLLLGYYYAFTLLYLADCRYRELRADRVAAEICGPQSVRNALIKTHLVSQLPELSIEALWEEYCQNEKDMHNLYAEHRQRWEQLPAGRRERAESEMFLRRGSVWQTHPSLAERVRNLADVAAHELTGDEPAARLFHQWEALERQVTDRIVSSGRAMYQDYMDRMDRQLRIGV